MAFGKASGSGLDATKTDCCLGYVNGSISAQGTTGSLRNSHSSLRGGAASGTGHNNPTGVSSPYIAYLAAFDNPSSPAGFVVGAGQSVKIATFMFTNTGIVDNAVFGMNNGETGLYAYDSGGGSGIPPLGSSGYSITSPIVQGDDGAVNELCFKPYPNQQRFSAFWQA